MSDPYSIQSVGRLGGSLGGRARVVSSVSPVHRQKFTYPTALTGPVVSIIAAATLPGRAIGHVDFGSGTFGVFSLSGSYPTLHLWYDVWQATRSTLAQLSSTDLGVVNGGVYVAESHDEAIAQFDLGGGVYAAGITFDSSGATLDTDLSSFGFAQGAPCALSATRYMGFRNDGNCVLGTKESGSWDTEFMRPTGWAVNSRSFYVSLPLSTTDLLVIYDLAGTTTAAVLTVDTSSGHPYTATPGAETSLTGFGFPQWFNLVESMGLRLGARQVRVSDGVTAMVLTCNGSVAVSEVRTLPAFWNGFHGAQVDADTWLGDVSGGAGQILWDGSVWTNDPSLVALDASVLDAFALSSDRFINLNGTAVQLLTWPHHT